VKKMLPPIASTSRRRDCDALLMHAENCYLVAVYRGLAQAETWMYIWLLRLAGAPA
jgi:hypothetical protein